MAWYNWSKTAANNSNADPSINWAAGMSASSVEPSGRAMMAAGAQWRDDISGTITTGGTLNAYTVTSNQVFDTLAHLNGALLAFLPHVTNGAIVTLNVDGLGAKPLRSSPGVELGAGVLVQGTPYTATYVNADGAFYLQNFFGNPFNIPIGGLMPYLGAAAPNANFVLPFGQAISRTTYATLFALVSTTFGAGDGTTTFNVPDLRGRSIFGLDNMGGSAASRITSAGSGVNGLTLGSAGGNQLMQIHTHGVTDPGHAHTYIATNQNNQISGTGPSAANSGANGAATDSAATGITIQNSGSGASQNMPPAMVLPYILRVI